MRIFILIFCCITQSTFGFGQCQGCEKLLIPDYQYLSLSEGMSLNYLSIVDQNNFHEKSIQMMLGATIPIYGIPINFSGSYENFSKDRDALFSQKHIQYDYNKSVQEIKSGLNSLAYSSYNECLRNCNDAGGIFVEIVENDADFIHVVIKYKPYPGSKEYKKLLAKIEIGPNLAMPNISVPDTVEDRLPTDMYFRRNLSGHDSYILFTFSSLNGDNKETRTIPIPGVPRYETITYGRYENIPESKLNQPHIILYGQSIDDNLDLQLMKTDPAYKQKLGVAGEGCHIAGHRVYGGGSNILGEIRILFGPWSNIECGYGGEPDSWHITACQSCCLHGVDGSNSTGCIGLQNVTVLFWTYDY